MRHAKGTDHYSGLGFIRYIEKLVNDRVADCYMPGELDAIYRDKGQESAFQARARARNKATFADETLESEFQTWQVELTRKNEEGLQRENSFLDRLETDYRAEYEDPEQEAEFKKWLLGGWLLTPDRELQEQAESWARSSIEYGQAIVAGENLSESR